MCMPCCCSRQERVRALSSLGSNHQQMFSGYRFKLWIQKSEDPTMKPFEPLWTIGMLQTKIVNSGSKAIQMLGIGPWRPQLPSPSKTTAWHCSLQWLPKIANAGDWIPIPTVVSDVLHRLLGSLRVSEWYKHQIIFWVAWKYHPLN